MVGKFAHERADLAVRKARTQTGEYHENHGGRDVGCGPFTTYKGVIWRGFDGCDSVHVYQVTGGIEPLGAWMFAASSGSVHADEHIE